MAKKSVDKSQLVGIVQEFNSDDTQDETAIQTNESGELNEVFSESPTPAPQKPPETVAVAAELLEITITIPLRRGGKHYASRHVETKLDPIPARDLSDVLDALRAAGTKLPKGKKIQTTADAVRWIFFRISEAANAHRND